MPLHTLMSLHKIDKIHNAWSHWPVPHNHSIWFPRRQDKQRILQHLAGLLKLISELTATIHLNGDQIKG